MPRKRKTTVVKTTRKTVKETVDISVIQTADAKQTQDISEDAVMSIPINEEQQHETIEVPIQVSESEQINSENEKDSTQLQESEHEDEETFKESLKGGIGKKKNVREESPKKGGIGKKKNVAEESPKKGVISKKKNVREEPPKKGVIGKKKNVAEESPKKGVISKKKNVPEESPKNLEGVGEKKNLAEESPKTEEIGKKRKVLEESPKAEEIGKKKNLLEDSDTDRDSSMTLETPQKKETKPIFQPTKRRKTQQGNNNSKKKRKLFDTKNVIISNYKRYVYKVLKQVHPDLGISSMAMTIINGLMNDMFVRIAEEGSKLCKYTDKKTLSIREIEGAVKLVVPGELGKHSITEGSKAVGNYMNYEKK